LRLAREAGFVAEIIPHRKHPKLKISKNGRSYQLTLSASPTNRDVMIRNVERDLRVYCNG